MSPGSLTEKRLSLFPVTAQITGDRLNIASMPLDDLAEKYGTPLYLYDQATLDQSVQEYFSALSQFYPGPSGVTYAGKAYLSLAMAQWARSRGLKLDCTGAGEISIAVAAGVPPGQILVHGVSKSTEDLESAMTHAGTIVVDNLHELYRILELRSSVTHIPDLWLRLRPGLAVDTHAYTQTGQDDSKFGMSPSELLQAVHLCQVAGLPLTGLHFHQGSHFHDPTPIAPALETALDLIDESRASLGWAPQVLSPGGGWGVPYHEDDLPHQPIGSYVGFIAERLIAGCNQRSIPLPDLQLEPGRSIVARAGVAVYRVEAVKITPHRRWLLLDGGMADNPRPALYRAHYTALPVLRPQREPIGPAWLAGPYCESGDILIEALPMAEIQPGEWVAIPVSGAYQLSMSSNYNGARRPVVLWLTDGEARLIQRRETPQDLLNRDIPLDF